MKFNNLLKTVALGGVVLGATTLFAGCKTNKDNNENNSDNSTPSYINQTYSAMIENSGIEPMSSSSTDNDWEKDVVSVKLKENNVAYLVYDLRAYQGTWAENTNTAEEDFDITITDDEDQYSIEMVVNGENVSLKDKIGSETLLGNNSIELSKKDDVLFENGLYVGLGSYNQSSGYSTNIEGGSYTYKISDSEIYSSDDVCSSNRLNVESIGNQLIYSMQYDRAGEDGETNLFFVEKKGEHNAAFISTFGDLDYVIYHVESESSGLNRYYETKANSTTTTLQITQNITFNATKLFKTEWVITNPDTHAGQLKYTYENVNMQLEVKTDGTVQLTITGNEKYNVTTGGKWYNIGQKSAQGLLIVLDNKDFFDGFLALGTYDDDNITIQHLLEDEVTSDISATDDISYEIGWNEESETEILNGHDWVLEN